MLVKVFVDNFKSFSKPTELTMISSSKIRKHADHQIKVHNTKVLKYAVIYGANASGKSNLVDIFSFIQFVLENGLPVKSDLLFCRTNKENEERESTFELHFSIDNEFYAYGFSTILSKRIITSEWLYLLYQNGSSQCIFERNKSEKAQVLIKINSSEKSRFDTYAEDFINNDIGLFLSEVNRGKRYSADSKLIVLEKVYTWLRDNIVVYTPNSKLVNLKNYYNKESLSKIVNMIRMFDTGISDIHIVDISLEEIKKDIPTKILEDMLKELSEAISQEPNQSTNLSIRAQNTFYNISVDEKQEIKFTTIKLDHGICPYKYTFDEESDGTRRVFDFIDMLLYEGDDTVFIIDELERSLHPLLTEQFINLFSQVHSNRRNQLIFTTHEATLMDQYHFRRDEFWLVAKNGKNESNIYSLDRFKERFDKDISKAYLQGRYGAIPVLSRNINSGVD